MIKNILKEMRITHWFKNLVVFLPIFFGQQIFDLQKIKYLTVAFVVLSLTASVVYIINDIIDLEDDRKHKIKKNRSLASGKLSVKNARFIALVITVISSILLIILNNPVISLIIFSYLLINILYSLFLKNIPILEIFILASNYLLRVYLGGIAGDLDISPWLFITILFGSFILIIGKRYTELKNYKTRKVLDSYTLQQLNNMLLISVAVTISAFALYVVNLGLNHLLQLIILSYILFRYYYLVDTTTLAEQPEKVFFADKSLFISTALFFVVSLVILYV